MAGAALNEKRIATKHKRGKKSGLFDRLGSHASGYRSGDRFNIYIADLYVMPNLTEAQIAKISEGQLSFDSLIREFIRMNMSYQYIITPHHMVRDLEYHIQQHGLLGKWPRINARRKKQ